MSQIVEKNSITIIKKAGNFALTPNLKDFLTQVFYENKDSIAFISG